MNIITTTDQAECLAALEALDLTGKVVPVPPNTSCAGLDRIGPDCWLIIENIEGRYALHLLEHCDRSEAFRHFDMLNSKWRVVGNFRLLMPDAAATN